MKILKKISTTVIFLAGLASIISLFIQIGSLKQSVTTLQQQFVSLQNNSNSTVSSSTVTAPINPNNSPSNNLAPGAVNYGAMAAGNGAQATVNKLATYIWENSSTWTSLEQGTDTFATILNFTGSSSILPNQVCAQIISQGVAITSVDPWSSSGWSGGVTSGNGQQGNAYFYQACFTPTQNQMVQVLSSQPLQYITAQLINNSD